MKFPSLRVDLRIALIYAIFGGVWIALSDRLLAVFITDITLLTRLQTYKGWIYVVFSAVLVYFLVRRSLIFNEQMEAALRDGAERYRHTLDQMLEGAQIIGFDWRYLYVNAAAAAQGKQTPEALLGRTMMEMYPGIEDTELFAVLRRCMEERAAQRLENEFAFPDGSRGWFELSIEPAPEGIFILSINITERKQAQQEIERQLDRLKSLRAIDLAILGTTDLQLALRTLLDEISRHLGGDAVAIYLFNPHALTLEPSALIGFRRSDFGRVSIQLGEGITGRAALERRTVVVAESAVEHTSVRLQGFVAVEGIQAVYSTPLIARGNLIGTLNIYFRAPFSAGQDWLDFFELLAGQAALAVDIGRSAEDLRRTNLELALAYDTTIEGWSRALDLRDKETEGHTRRVAEMTMKLARAAGMSEAELAHIHRGALLHDIGKMGVPDQILLKPDALTEAEWAIMRMHPVFAYNLLAPIFYLRPALDIPYCHHEKWDGTGYPRGLKGEEIPLAARLFAVADVWDALRSDRPYRKAWRDEKVIEHIRSLTGTHFDPRAVDLFLKVLGDDSAAKG